MCVYMSRTEMCIHKCHELRLRVTYCHELRRQVRYCQGLKCVRIHDTNSDVYPQMSRTQMCIHKCHELRCVREHVMNSAGTSQQRCHPFLNITNPISMPRTQVCINTCHELRCVSIRVTNSDVYVYTNSRGIAASADAAYPYVYMCHEFTYVSINVTNSNVYVYISRTQQASQCQPTPISKSSTQHIHLLRAVSSLVMITHTPKMSMYCKKTKVETYVRIRFSI